MPQLKISLKNDDDAALPDCWKLYYAFLGRYYQRPVDAEAGFSMMVAYTCYEPWTIPLTNDEYEQFCKVRCGIFDAVFNVEVL